MMHGEEATELAEYYIREADASRSMFEAEVDRWAAANMACFDAMDAEAHDFVKKVATELKNEYISFPELYKELLACVRALSSSSSSTTSTSCCYLVQQFHTTTRTTRTPKCPKSSAWLSALVRDEVASSCPQWGGNVKELLIETIVGWYGEEQMRIAVGSRAEDKVDTSATVVVVDDAAYTGSQMTALLSELLHTGFRSIVIIVPFATEHALARLQHAKNTFVWELETERYFSTWGKNKDDDRFKLYRDAIQAKIELYDGTRPDLDDGVWSYIDALHPVKFPDVRILTSPRRLKLASALLQGDRWRRCRSAAVVEQSFTVLQHKMPDRTSFPDGIREGLLRHIVGSGGVGVVGDEVEFRQDAAVPGHELYKKKK